MGSPPGQGEDMEHPQHAVTIAKPFAVAKFQLTFDEWDACARHGECNNYRPPDNGWGRGRRPVIYVSWGDAKLYVAWLTKLTGKPYRLLSEAEYEYATRAGTTTMYPWGDDNASDNAHCGSCSSQWHEQTAPVGSFPANGFGLYDMVGNVYEFTQDCFRYDSGYGGAPTDGSAWISPNCESPVVRGGAWWNSEYTLRSAARTAHGFGDRDDVTGFRVGRTLVTR